MKLKTLAAALSLAAVSALAAAPVSAKELKVVATFSIIGDFARQVGGDRIALTTLVPAGGDAHVYEPRPADAAAIGRADVVLANGLHFEGFLQRLIDASGSKAQVATLTDGVQVLRNTEEAEHDHNHDHDHGKGAHDGHEDHDAHAGHGHEGGHHHHGPNDPHAWQSIANAQVYVKNIADAFCKADQEGCATYRANAESYTKTLQALDAEVKADVAQIPADKRTIITSHDAFGYYAKTYGFTFLAPQGISTDSEASAADVAKLVKQIKDEKAAALFTENISNPRLIQQIANETGLKQGGELYSDALSKAGGPATTYVDMMRHNTVTIRAAILGK
ncbi:periplasmic solute-binding protein [Bordetella ansorpii]|uniref:Periplasmic solute-binding protein n=1 Tax=Bordetella ansorpii TaxID=288768 RepID=A0A157P9I9_9BORD|nr:metal ABC transporter substrate-binding protein [Bordetella ansorpii]SAI29914.1 periplasmic solute-binding protein [Bordetella ansorpii]